MNQYASVEEQETISLPDILPLLPVKGPNIFPFIIFPLSVGPGPSARAVDHALADNRLVVLVAQKDASVEDPEPSQLYEVGTAALIMRMLKLPDGRIRILVQGLARVKVEYLGSKEPFLQAQIRPLIEETSGEHNLQDEALVRNIQENLERAVHLGRNISPEVMVLAANVDSPGRLADLAASNLDLRLEDAQALLETLDPLVRLQKASELLHREIELLTMQQEISSQARDEIDRSQKEYFLRQQLKAIQRELGEDDDFSEEVEGYRRLARERSFSEEAVEELEKQIQRLERSHPDSAEASVIRTYLDSLTSLPWGLLSEDNLDLDHAQKVLDEDHYDLSKIKKRILEFLAVRKLKTDAKGPVLCFVGPPGVGKTSLGRSIARALGRKFVRLSLGGVRDEAEIRGHRRTYVGALPGRILQGIGQAQTSNPVFMLDEIDKIGRDYRGDPSSALLEVLDPEQNFSFRDHYLSIPYDLSKVIFIATANVLDTIHPAFLDRMEVIRLSGYTEEEKLEIALRHLVPKQIAENGLDDFELRFTIPGLKKLINGYTREAGLRNLEREIGAVCRKIAVKVATGKPVGFKVDPKRVEMALGPEKHFNEVLLQENRVGVVAGLAWTEVGGDLMFIEAVAVPGEGKLLLTGNLGDIMKESAQTALSYARSYASAKGYSEDFFKKHDLHVHAPAGAIPKDGPSAGITVTVALISLLTKKLVDRRIAMTGEITLRGDILPIGGLKEKVLAARAAGVHRVVAPALNKKDLKDFPTALRRDLEYIFVDSIDQVLEAALVDR